MAAGVAIVFISAKPLSGMRREPIHAARKGQSAARTCAARLQGTREVGAASMVPPLALEHVQQQLQHIALSSARAREDIDRLFDAATAPVAPAESEDASIPDLASPRKTPPEPLGLHLLPEDLSAICAGYLRVADVVTYSACSEATREWYESEEPWTGFLEPLNLS